MRNGTHHRPRNSPLRPRKALFLLLTVVLLCGCTTGGGDLSAYSRDGVQYGITQGRFRGRWWNYYERGRSYLDGGFWLEAERDFRAALAGRGRDQLWPRTYGLHFIPEYFPQRELGIALYQQGRVEEAMKELEGSLDALHSARAAYYLDKARTDWIEAEQADATPPSVEIIAPTSASPLCAVRTELVGVARDDTFVAGISIGDETFPIRVSAAEIPFSSPITLAPGANAIPVTVIDLAGKRTATTVRVQADVDGPVVSFDHPVVAPGTIRGVAFDPAGVAYVRIAGRLAELSRADDTQMTFSLDLRQEDLDPPLAYASEDGFGNRTEGRLPLDTVMVSELAPPSRSRAAHVVFASARPAVVPITETVQAVYAGHQLVAVTTTPYRAASRLPDVRFFNLREGQRYFRDEIVVALEVDAASPLERVELNGAAVATIPGRTVQYLSRRMPLAYGANEVVARARDREGHAGESRVSVERRPTQIEQLGRRLHVAMLGNVWRGNSPLLEGETEFIIQELMAELARHDRFTLVDRSLMPEVLSEQQLAVALGSGKERFALGMIVPADVMIVGRVHRDATTIEIVLEAVSTETSLVLARADVAGVADDLEQLRGLLADLALRLVQEFPRVQGRVAQVRKASSLPGPSAATGQDESVVRVSEEEAPDPAQAGHRLNIALLGNVWKESNPLLAGEADFILEALRRELAYHDRFNVVDRALMPEVLAEQELSTALGSREKRLALGRTVPAEVMIIGRVHRDGDAIAIFVEATSSETALVVARTEVSGMARDLDELSRLVKILAGQIVEELPRTPNQLVLDRTRGGVVTDLNSAHRVRESMKCVLFRYGDEIIDPVTQESLGRDTTILGEALLRSVDAQRSTAVVLYAEGEELSPLTIQVGDQVVIK